MKPLIYSLAILTLLWLPAAWQVVTQPKPYPYRIVRPEFQNAGLQIDCKEALRICRQRLRSSKTKETQ